MQPRRIKPHCHSWVNPALFEERDAGAAMQRIGEVVDRHRQGTVHRDPIDALASVFYEVCASEQYGEPVPPARLSMEAREAIINKRFEEDYQRPVADLWTMVNRAHYGRR